MDLYISKSCPHCRQLLILFHNNKHLISYFNIMDIETNPYPQSVTSVPTLIKDGILFLGDKLNEILNDVNKYHMSQNGPQQQQQQMPQQQQQQMPQQQMPQQQQQGVSPQRQQQQQGVSPHQQMPQQQMPQQQKKDDKEEEITGICDSEGCLFESLDDNKNNLNGNYCFLDDGYSEEKPSDKPNNSGTGEKTGRFDNNAYEEMMKNRGA